MKRWQLSALLILGLILSGVATSAEASRTPGSVAPPQHGWIHQRGASVLVIETAFVDGSIHRALDELSVTYDVFFGDIFSGVDLSPYDQVFVAMDGGLMDNASIQNVAEWARLGGCAHFYGGSCWGDYAAALNQYFLENDQNNWCWQTVAGVPDVTVTNAAHYLASGLPATYNFVDDAASYYQTRSTDGALQVAARNGDGYAMLGSKPFLAGNFDICINSPYSDYYLNPTDYNWLKQVVANMLTCGAATAVEPTTWGQVKSLY
jgi:hypothetical protein